MAWTIFIVIFIDSILCLLNIFHKFYHKVSAHVAVYPSTVLVLNSQSPSRQGEELSIRRGIKGSARSRRDGKKDGPRTRLRHRAPVSS